MPELARHDERQAFPTCLGDNGQDAELLAVMRAAFDEVVGPYMAGIFRTQPDARPVIEPQATALWLTLRDLQPLAAPDPLDPLVVHCPSRMAEQRGHPAITVAAILLRQCDYILRQHLFVIRPAWRFALRRSMLTQHPADPSLGLRKLLSNMIDAAPSPRGAQKFPRAASRNISLSNVRSEIARRSRRFSFS